MSTFYIVLLVLLLYWQLVIFLDRRGTLEKYNISAYGPILMIRTSKGQEFLDRLAVHKKFWRIFADIGLPAMLLGMLVMFVLILLPVVTSIQTQTVPQPSKFNEIQNILFIPGVNEFVPLVWGIIGLMVTLVVHEFSHAILSKVEGVRVKSMGILLALIPIGGFAEPDEEQLLGKRPEKDNDEEKDKTPKKYATRRERVRILTAGVMANFVTALVAFIVFFSLLGSLSPVGEVMIADVIPGQPADQAGVKPNMVLTGINGNDVNNAADFLLYAKPLEPGSKVTLDLFDRGERKEIQLIAIEGNNTLTGVPVAGVVEGSPAEAAGIKAGMILIKMDDTELNGLHDFIEFMNSTTKGQKVDVHTMSNSSVNASVEIFNDVELAGSQEKGFLGVSYSLEENAISYSMGLSVGQFPASGFLQGMKNIPSSMTELTGWGHLFILPFFDLDGEIFPRFKIDLLTYFYEPSGWAASIGAGLFILLNIFLWVGWTNFIAGLFNCLPAVPLDGGHVFRDVMTAILTRTVGDGEKVERISEAIVLLFALLVLSSFLFIIVVPRVAHLF